MHRRDLLRWAGYLAVAAAVGCRPSAETRGNTAAAVAARAEPPPSPAPPPRSVSGPLQPRDAVDPDDFARRDIAEGPPEDVEEPAEQPLDEPSDDPTEASDDVTEEPDSTVEEPDEEPDEGTDSEVDEAADDSPATRQIEVICRDALGLAPAAAGGAAHTIGRLTLHHTEVVLGDNRKAPGRLRGHQSFHQDNGWVDIAYHFGVDRRGNIYELRDPGIAGETFTEYDPAGHFLVVCEGDYNHEVPPDAMLQATAEILAYGARRFGVSADTLTGHRDHAGTTCPGHNLYPRLGELRTETARLAALDLQHTSLCGSAGRDRVAAIEAG